MSTTPVPSPPPIASLTLIRTRGNTTAGPIADGAVIDLSRLGDINVRADMALVNSAAGIPAVPAGSVVFRLDGHVIATENSAPFAVAGDDGRGHYNPWAIPDGPHTLTVTPWSAPRGQGTHGASVTVHFTVTGSEYLANFPTRLTWQYRAPAPQTLSESVGAAVDGKVYVFGGFYNEGAGDGIHYPCSPHGYAYDVASNTWKTLRDMPEPFTHANGVVVGKTIWFVGGFQGDAPGPGSSHVWKYDTVTDTWSRGPDLPAARGGGSAALIGRTLFFCGGLDQTRTVEEGTTWALDLDHPDLGWRRKADMPNPRNHIAVAAVGGRLYAVGGQHGQITSQVAQDEVDMFDPSQNRWTKVASLPAPRSHIQCATLEYGGRLLVLGGESGSGDPCREVYAYDPVANRWSILGLLPTAHSTLVCGVVKGKLVALTGNAPNPSSTGWVGTFT